MVLLLGGTSVLRSTTSVTSTVGGGAKRSPLVIDTGAQRNVRSVHQTVVQHLPRSFSTRDVAKGLISTNSLILLIVPRSVRTPGKQLVLPRTRALQRLLSGGYVTIDYAASRVRIALQTLSHPPGLVVASSRIFGAMCRQGPTRDGLASFSILFTTCGKSVNCCATDTTAVNALGRASHVLVTRTYARTPLSRSVNQIGLPHVLHRGVNRKLRVSVMSNGSFPTGLGGCSLVVRYNTYVFGQGCMLDQVTRTGRRGMPVAGCKVTVT